MDNRIHQELLKRLYFLNTSEWPDEPVILPQEGDKKLSEVHRRSFEIICVLAEVDAEALAFKRKVYASVRPDPFGQYSEIDLLRSACQYAGPTYRRLTEEKQKLESDLQNDPVGHAQRSYISQLAQRDPFAEHANLAVAGLARMPREQVTDCPLGGVLSKF